MVQWNAQQIEDEMRREQTKRQADHQNREGQHLQDEIRREQKKRRAQHLQYEMR
jgi:hypothetical protein